jgi:hypothetical protein
MRGKESISALKFLLIQSCLDLRWGEKVVIEHVGGSQNLMSIGLKLTHPRGCHTLSHEGPPGGSVDDIKIIGSSLKQRHSGLDTYTFEQNAF